MYCDYTIDEIKELKAVVKIKKPIHTSKKELTTHQKTLETSHNEFSIKKLATLGTVKRILSETVLFSQGDEGSEMYFILQGEVGIFVDDMQVTTLDVGNFFGEMSLLDHEPRSATVIAGTDLILLTITQENLEKVIEAMPSLAVRMLKALSTRIRTMNSLLTDGD